MRHDSEMVMPRRAQTIRQPAPETPASPDPTGGVISADRSMSGLPLDPIYAPSDGTPDDIGEPGEYPFTRGVYETMYRGKLWTMRMFAGFGTPAQTNERFHKLLAAGQTGLSTAFDMPTLMGRDPDDP